MTSRQSIIFTCVFIVKYISDLAIYKVMLTNAKLSVYILEVYRYIGLTKYRLPIWQNFQYRQLVFFEIVPIFLPIFYTSTNWLILLMHCLVVAIFYCVDNHFTSFVAILLLLTMVYNELYFIILYV